ncbi:glycoside hydrolase family 2 [Polaribacter haliotis]|uniref:Glycoside hydrolase family 2 n=1 Tax=Polaribacter haliotis TaxID=1888915 RepID=A0A7L8AIM2_9FLAO|nr:sugar-binding domain-containing protein [Polaribacter haliotis]QOD61817.1 glycoside hydrolase family 2 [Polaribacter haliotis]
MYKNCKLITLLLCLSFSAFMAQEKDQFAQIGNKVQGTRLHLLEDKLPPVLPDLHLPKMKGKKAAFSPMNKMDTKAELQAELQKMRNKFIPFMKNYAPKVKKTRARLDLTKFDWRLGTAEDKTDFSKVIAGNGSWESVSVPHYGPPEGKATTYYRKEFELTPEMLQYKSQFVHFKGVDYWAKVFINGNLVGEHTGFFAPFEFDITKYLKPGKNTLIVQVDNDYTTLGSFDGGNERKIGNKIYAASGLGWDDPKLGWHHCPAGMGIYQDCYIEARDPLHINDVFVRPMLDKNEAEVWLEINNYYEDFKNIKLRFNLYGQNFKETIIKDLEYIPMTTYIPGVGDLAKPQDGLKSRLMMGYETNYLKVTIPIESPRLWNNETPWLYQLQTEVLDENGNLTDAKATHFGMRSFTQDTISIPKGQMYLNGDKIKLRGANTMGFLQQDVKNKKWDQLIDDILLAKVSNMNFIRLTQRPVQSEIYDYADMLGIMLQTDLPLFGSIRQNLFAEGVKQAGEMERLVRNHPSNIMVTYINERFPNGEGHPQRSMASADDYMKFFKACDQIVNYWNPDRVIKPGDGDYDPPTPGLPDSHMYNVWYNGHALGLGELHKGYWQKTKPDWYYACGEFGAEGFDNYTAVQKYWPEEWLPKNKNQQWFPDKVSKAQTNRFHYMWYPTPVTVKDWIDASQNHQAWATRFVTEAFRRDNRMMSFAIHLFIDAWPAGWMKAIMDVDRNPKKAFYAYRDALAPLMVSLRTDRYHFYESENISIEAWLSNDLNKIPKQYMLKWQLEKNGKVVSTAQKEPKNSLNSSEFQGYIDIKAPKVSKRAKYQLRLGLFDENGKAVSESMIDLDVFPEPEKKKTSKVYSPSKNGLSTHLFEDLDVKSVNNADEASTIVIDNLEDYNKNKEALDKMVSQGKTLVFLELPVGEHKIGNKNILIEKTVMGQYYFVNPLSGHPLTKGFKPFDFKFWYNESKGFASAFLSTLIEVKDGWVPILKSGKTTWVGIAGESAAAVELKSGKGSFIVCQLQLKNHLKTNPTATIFGKRLLNQ